MRAAVCFGANLRVPYVGVVEMTVSASDRYTTVDAASRVNVGNAGIVCAMVAVMPESQVAVVAEAVPPMQNVPPESTCRVVVLPGMIVCDSVLKTAEDAICNALPDTLSKYVTPPRPTTVGPELIVTMWNVVPPPGLERNSGVPDALPTVTFDVPSLNVPAKPLVNNDPEVPVSVIVDAFALKKALADEAIFINPTDNE